MSPFQHDARPRPTRPRPTRSRPTRSRAARLAALLPALAVAACTGATIGSGVGTRLLEHPPYYAGQPVAPGGAVAVLPVAYQRGGSEQPGFDPADGPDTPMAALLAEMNAYLDSLDAGVRIAGAAPAPGAAPDVRFGCATDPIGDCAEPSLGGEDDDRRLLRLEVGRPSQEWVVGTAERLASAGADRVVLVTVEVGQYYPRQKNWRGDKVVELGSGHTVSLPWLTSLETPVSVLQLTGALVGADGRAIRIGAEGMLARRTPLLASAVGAQALITDEDVERLRTARRDDLPGRPLAWQVALRTLVAGLTGRSAPATGR